MLIVQTQKNNIEIKETFKKKKPTPVLTQCMFACLQQEVSNYMATK